MFFNVSGAGTASDTGAGTASDKGAGTASDKGAGIASDKGAGTVSDKGDAPSAPYPGYVCVGLCACVVLPDLTSQSSLS